MKAATSPTSTVTANSMSSREETGTVTISGFRGPVRIIEDNNGYVRSNGEWGL